MKKVFFAIAMLAAAIFSANAEDEATLNISADKTSVTKGETVTITVTLATDFEADAYQLDITMPTGLTMPTFTERGVVYPDPTYGVSSLNAEAKFVNGGTTTFRVIGEPKRSTSVISEAIGATATLLSFELNTENATAGTDTITLSDVVVTNCNNKNSKYSVHPGVTLTAYFTVIEPTYKLVLNGTEHDMADTDNGVYTYNTSEKIDPASYSVAVKYGSTTYYIAEAISKTNTSVALSTTSTTYKMESDTQAAYYGFTLTVAEGGALNLAVDYSGEWPTGCDNIDAATAEKLFRDGKVIIRRNGADYTVLGQKL